MTSPETALRRINSDLTQAGVPFAVVGGLAVSVRTEPRFTRPADLAVALSTDRERWHSFPRCEPATTASSELYSALRRQSNWRARQGLALIARRGCHRGRDLASEQKCVDAGDRLSSSRCRL